jgi:acetyl esterase/lipase
MKPVVIRAFPACTLVFLLLFSQARLFGADHQVVRLWPGKPPGETRDLPPETDTTTPDANKVAGQRVMRIGNVSTPTLTVYPAPVERANGAAMVICPGGGHYILAWDLEGTEIAEWLNSLGVTAFVLKYRVPGREENRRWRAAVQDAQRAVSVVRGRAAEFAIDPDRIGLMGFSAGGETAVLATLFDERTYDDVDELDEVSLKPNFTGLIYSAGIVDRETLKMHDYVKVTEETPPIFMAHAFDDSVPLENCLRLMALLKEHNVPGELHVYSEGGHGYGLRTTRQPVTSWNDRMADWMRVNGWLGH